MKSYSKPCMKIRSFRQENIKTEDIVVASAETYVDWAAREQAKAMLERKFIDLAEITKFKF